MTTNRFGRLGLIVGGGPAPGINGVISAVTIEAIERGFEVIGFRDGFKHLVEGKIDQNSFLTIPDVKGVKLRGGSILRTSRKNPAKSEEMMRNVLEVFRKLNITHLVTIGGDDTAYSGSQVYKHAKGTIRVAHVPKTIDNDLPLPPSTPTFGYETARQVGVGIVKNLNEDARTTSRWYLVVTMGRAAGHLALGIGKAAAAPLTIIPEEFGQRHTTLDEICDIVLGSIIKRKSWDINYGVAVLAEGLIEAIGRKNIEAMWATDNMDKYGELTYDQHDNLELRKIAFGRMIKDRLTARLEEVGLETAVVAKDLGYELRCADPIPFDAEYTRDLGYGAVQFLLSKDAEAFGAIINLVGGVLTPLAFDAMLDPKTKRMTTRRVNISGEGYQCARNYMIRLVERDLTVPEKLEPLAKTVKMTPNEFRARFGYIVPGSGNSP